MKLTPFGFVTQTEGFLREALSLPPVGGGKWSLQRVINFTDQAGALQVLLEPEAGPQKVKMTFHARQTGSFKDSGIQGWIEFNEGESKDPFVLKKTQAAHVTEEIFDIVDRALTNLPEWDNAAGITAPPPAPHSGAGFEPMMSPNDAKAAEPSPNNDQEGSESPTAPAPSEEPEAIAEPPPGEDAGDAAPSPKKNKAPKAKKASK